MQYRRLGRTGLRLSTLSLGSWVTYHNQVDTGQAREMMAAAYGAALLRRGQVDRLVITRPAVEAGPGLHAMRPCDVACRGCCRFPKRVPVL